MTSLINKVTLTINDLARRLLRTEEDSINEELPAIVNHYDFKLIWSGYLVEERTKIIESGFVDYRNRIKNLNRKVATPISKPTKHWRLDWRKDSLKNQLGTRTGPRERKRKRSGEQERQLRKKKLRD